MTEKVRRWAVVHRPARGRGEPELWLVLEGVPWSLSAREVMSTLEGTAWWPSWQRRIGMGARVMASTERAWKPELAAQARDFAPMQWSALTPPTRRVSIPLPADVWAKVRQAAANEGLSMQAWCASVLGDVAGRLIKDAADA